MLADSIYKTLLYFDAQEHPLTLLEIQKYLLRTEPEQQAASLSEIVTTINQMPDRVEHDGGFYFLPGKKHFAQKRLENNFTETQRYKRASKFLPYLRFVPFISGAAVSGSVAISNSKQGSDIDLLVLTKPKRIWLARIFLSVYFQARGMRRHKQHIADRFCLNHYVNESKVIDQEKNVYTAVEYVSLIPFFGGDKILEFQKNQQWIVDFLVQTNFVEAKTPRPSFFKKMVEALFNNQIGDLLEKYLGKLQAYRITLQDSIIITEDELAFHPGNKGRQILEKVLKY